MLELKLFLLWFTLQIIVFINQERGYGGGREGGCLLDLLFSQEEISKMKMVWGINLLRRMLSEGAVEEDVKE